MAAWRDALRIASQSGDPAAVQEALAASARTRGRFSAYDDAELGRRLGGGPLPLFYMNVDASTDRANFVDAQCELHEFLPRRVSAVTPFCDAYAAAEAAHGSRFMEEVDKWTGAGANAINLSFVKAFEAAAEGPDEIAVVCEDDTAFAHDFRPRLKACAKALVDRGLDCLWMGGANLWMGWAKPETYGETGQGLVFPDWPVYVERALLLLLLLLLLVRLLHATTALLQTCYHYSCTAAGAAAAAATTTTN